MVSRLKVIAYTDFQITAGLRSKNSRFIVYKMFLFKNCNVNLPNKNIWLQTFLTKKKKEEKIWSTTKTLRIEKNVYVYV